MILLPLEIVAGLRANAARRGDADHDPVPVVKLFNPLGPATWLATELHEDGDTLFGLADLGMGCPELGYFSLSELASIRLPFGLRIERDIAFETRHRLSAWAAWSRRSGSILWAETMIRRVEASTPPGEPLPLPDPDRSRRG